MRAGLLLGLMALAGCMAADPLPTAGARAQADRLEGTPMVGPGATMSLPYITPQGTYDIQVPQVRGDLGGMISVGTRTAPALEEAKARQVADAGCRLVGRTPALTTAVQDGLRWDFAGGCK